MKTRPAPDEYAPYYEKYVSLVAEGDLFEVLAKQLESSINVIRKIPEEKAGHRYAEGKWSIKELLGHVIDTERIFSYRALRIARDDRTPLPGFEQDDYVANANFEACRLMDLGDEFEFVRKANIYLFKHFAPDAWLRRGVASEKEVSVRALAYMIAGHEAHHMIILRSRYL